MKQKPKPASLRRRNKQIQMAYDNLKGKWDMHHISAMELTIGNHFKGYVKGLRECLDVLEAYIPFLNKSKPIIPPL